MTDIDDALVPLREYFEALLAEHRRAVEVALLPINAALETNERLQIERIDAVRREAQIALQASETAITKSEQSGEKRFASFDALRAELGELAERQMDRIEADAKFTSIDVQLGVLAELKANERLQVERIESLRRETLVMRENADKAIEKSDAATEKRFDAVNAFRAQLADQATQFIPREVADSMISDIRARVDANAGLINTMGNAGLPRETFDTTLREWAAWRSGIDKRLNETAGNMAGTAKTTNYVIAAVGLLLTIIIFAASHFTGH